MDFASNLIKSKLLRQCCAVSTELSRSPSDAMTASPARSKPTYNIIKIYSGAFKPNAKPKIDTLTDMPGSVVIFNQKQT